MPNSRNKFRVGFQVQHEIPEEGRKTYRPTHCGYNNKDDVNGPNILSKNN